MIYPGEFLTANVEVGRPQVRIPMGHLFELRNLSKDFSSFFTPISYTSSLPDGTTRNFFLSTWIRKSTQFVVSGYILFLPPFTQGEKKDIWTVMESNLGLLVSQATALTTRPWLLGQIN